MENQVLKFGNCIDRRLLAKSPARRAASPVSAAVWGGRGGCSGQAPSGHAEWHIRPRGSRVIANFLEEPATSMRTPQPVGNAPPPRRRGQFDARWDRRLERRCPGEPLDL